MHHQRVLVVDDDQNILAAFRDFLKKEHYGMIAASTAEEALERLKERTVDLVITDVRLKAQSGVMFSLEVKRIRPNIPIIMVTGYPEVVSEQDARVYGADYFFVKPLNLDTLREAVRKCLP